MVPFSPILCEFLLAFTNIDLYRDCCEHDSFVVMIKQFLCLGQGTPRTYQHTSYPFVGELQFSLWAAYVNSLIKLGGGVKLGGQFYKSINDIYA